MTPIITVIITLVVVGLILWLINRYIPMASSIKSILNVVVSLAFGVAVRAFKKACNKISCVVARNCTGNYFLSFRWRSLKIASTSSRLHSLACNKIR